MWYIIVIESGYRKVYFKHDEEQFEQLRQLFISNHISTKDWKLGVVWNNNLRDNLFQ